MAGPGYWKVWFEGAMGTQLDYLMDFGMEKPEITVHNGDLVNHYDTRDLWTQWLKEDPLMAYTDLYQGLNDCFINLTDRPIFFPKVVGRLGDVIHIHKAVTRTDIKYFTTEGFVLLKKSNLNESINKFYTCSQCGTIHIRPLASGPPKECDDCKKRYTKKWEVEEGDTARLTLMEIGDNNPDGTMETVTAFVFGLNTDDIQIGQRIRLNCIKNMQKEGKYWVSKLMVIGWEGAEFTWEDVEFDDKPNFTYDQILASVCPNVVGNEPMKESVLLQMVMDGFNELGDGTRKRRWMNILLAGDPGTAKSAIMDYVEQVHPKVVRGGGARSSKAGLTVSVVPDPIDSKKRTHRAGVLVRGHKGIALIDEFDKMSDEDKKSIQSAMEQGVIDVAMAETNAQFKTETPVLAACNPKKGFFRYDRDQEILLDQLDIPKEILSRFDLIWVFVDKRNNERDASISEQLGTEWCKKSNSETVIDVKDVRRYVAWARNLPDPELPDDVLKEISSWYVLKRGEITEERMINPRTYQTLMRMTFAFAKLDPHFGVDGKAVVTEHHFKRASKLYHGMIKLLSPGGDWDVNPIYTGKTSKFERIQERILSTFRTYDEITMDDLKEYLNDVDSFKIEEHVKKLLDNGQILEPRQGYYRMVR